MTDRARDAARPPRAAMLLLPGLDHFAPDLLAGLSAPGVLEVRGFPVRSPADLEAALAWTDDPARDSVWFEFCWPPFPDWIARTEFGGRRVVVRVHRIEAYGTEHAARAPWWKVDDAVVVGPDMARRLREAVPALEPRTRLHVVPNGVDLLRFGAAQPVPRDPFRIGWCGWVSLHKNPVLALDILHRLRLEDPRWRLHLASKGGEAVAMDSLRHLIRRNGLADAVQFDGALSPADMPGWHARNAVLLSTSHYESFGYAIAEAAAAGCDLAVLDHAGAGETWPAPVLFGTADEACALVRAARPDRWRGHVERFGLPHQIEALRDLLLAPRPAAGKDGMDASVRFGTWAGRFPVRDAADHVQGTVLRTGRFYEEEMLADIQRHLPRGGLFVDVGANVGNHALFAAGVCGAQVLAFEPSPTLADQCRDALAANGLSGQLTLRRLGVGAAPARAALVPGPPGNAGMTSLDLEGEAGEGGGIEVVRLDDALDGDVPAPSVIKVDVEGMECDVLLGAMATLQRCRPALYVETATDDQFEAVSAVAAMLDYRPVRRFNATPTWLFLPAA